MDYQMMTTKAQAILKERIFGEPSKYQRIIEQSVTDGIGFVFQGEPYPDNNTDTALQARLASMDGASYDEVRELISLDEDLRKLGLSDKVTTPEAVQIALGLKRYITNIALSQARTIFVFDRDREKESKFIDLSPRNLETYSISKREDAEPFAKCNPYINKNIIDKILKKEN